MGSSAGRPVVVLGGDQAMSEAELGREVQGAGWRGCAGGGGAAREGAGRAWCRKPCFLCFCVRISGAF